MNKTESSRSCSSLREALRLAERHGCIVSKIRGTGEVKVYSPDLGKMVVFHTNCKDCPRRLYRFLVQLNSDRCKQPSDSGGQDAQKTDRP